MKKVTNTVRPFLVISLDRDHLRSRSDLSTKMLEIPRVDWAAEFVPEASSSDAFVLDIVNSDLIVYRGKEHAKNVLTRLVDAYSTLIDEAKSRYMQQQEDAAPVMQKMPKKAH